MRHEQTLRSFASLLTVEKVHHRPKKTKRTNDGHPAVVPPTTASMPAGVGGPSTHGAGGAGRAKSPPPKPPPVGSSPMIRGFMSSYGCSHGATCSVPSMDARPLPLPPPPAAAAAGDESSRSRQMRGNPRKGRNGAGGRGRRGGDDEEERRQSLPTQLLRSFLARGNPFPPPPSANKGKKKLQRRRRSSGGCGRRGSGAVMLAAAAAALAAAEEEGTSQRRESEEGGGGGPMDAEEDEVARRTAPDLGPVGNMSAPLYYTTEPGAPGEKGKKSPYTDVDATEDVATAPHVAHANITRTVREMLDRRLRRYYDTLVRKSVVENRGYVTDGASRVLGHDVSQRDVDVEEEGRQAHEDPAGWEAEAEAEAERILRGEKAVIPNGKGAVGADKGADEGKRDGKEKKEEGTDVSADEAASSASAAGGEKRPGPSSSSSFRVFSGRPPRVPRNAGASFLSPRTQTSRVVPTNHRVPATVLSSVTSFNVPRDVAGTATKQRRSSLPMLQEQQQAPQAQAAAGAKSEAEAEASSSSSPQPMDVDSNSNGGKPKDINPSEKTTCTTVITTVSMPVTFAAIVTVEMGGAGSGRKFDLEFGTGGQIVGSFRGPSSNPLLVGVDIQLDTHTLYSSMLDQVMLVIKRSMMSVIASTPSLQDQPTSPIGSPPAAALRRGSCASSVGGPPSRRASLTASAGVGGVGPCRRVSMASSLGGSTRSLLRRGGSARSLASGAGGMAPGGSADGLVELSARLGAETTRNLGGEGACPKAAAAAALLRRASMVSSMGGSARSLMSNLDIRSRRGSLASVGEESVGAMGAGAMPPPRRRGSSMIGASLAIHGDGDATLSRRSSMGGGRRTSMDHTSSAVRRTSMDLSVGAGGDGASTKTYPRAERRLSGVTRPAATFTAANIEKRRRVSNEFERRRASMEHARRLSVLGSSGGSGGGEAASAPKVITDTVGPAPSLPTTFDAFGGKEAQQRESRTSPPVQREGANPEAAAAGLQAMDAAIAATAGRRVSMTSTLAGTPPTGLLGDDATAAAAAGGLAARPLQPPRQQRRLSASEATAAAAVAQLMDDPASRPGGGAGAGAAAPADAGASPAPVRAERRTSDGGGLLEAAALLQQQDELAVAAAAAGRLGGGMALQQQHQQHQQQQDALATVAAMRRLNGGTGTGMGLPPQDPLETARAMKRLSGSLGMQAAAAAAVAGLAAERRRSARLSGAGGSMAAAAAAAQLQLQSELGGLEDMAQSPIRASASAAARRRLSAHLSSAGGSMAAAQLQLQSELNQLEDAQSPIGAAAARRRLGARLSAAGGSTAAAAAAAQLQFQSELNQLEEAQIQLAAAQASAGPAAGGGRGSFGGGGGRRGSFGRRRGSFQRRVSLDRELLGPILGDLAAMDGGQGGAAAATAAAAMGQRRRLSLEAQDIARMEEMTRLGLL